MADRAERRKQGQVLNTSNGEWDEGPSLLESLWRFRWLILAAVLLGALGAYALSVRQPHRYEAVARIFPSIPGQGSLSGGGSTTPIDPDRYVRNQSQLMTSAPVVSRAAKLSGLPPATWRNNLTVVPSKDLDLIVIRAKAGTPEQAARMVDSVVTAYQQVLAEQAKADLGVVTERVRVTTDKLRADLDLLRAKLRTSPRDPVLEAQLEATQGQLKAIVGEGVQVGVTATLSENAIRFRERAASDGVPVEPRPKRTAAGGAVFALFASSGLAWWLDRRGRTLATQGKGAAAPAGDAGPPGGAIDEELSLRPGATSNLPGDHTPVIGEVPSFSEAEVDGQVPAATAPGSAAANAYRLIAQWIEIASQEADLGKVLVTGPEPGDGRTVTTLNVAIAAAETGQRILVVDGDQWRRGLTNLCHIDGGAGLSNLIHDGGGEAGECIWLSEFPGIQVVPAGTDARGGSDLFRSPAFGAAMARIREHADLVLVDSPALSVAPDALNIAKHVDAAIVVVTPRTSLGVLQAARQRLDSAGVPVLGYVVNEAAAPDQATIHDNGSHTARSSVLQPEPGTGTG